MADILDQGTSKDAKNTNPQQLKLNKTLFD